MSSAYSFIICHLFDKESKDQAVGKKAIQMLRCRTTLATGMVIHSQNLTVSQNSNTNVNKLNRKENLTYFKL